MEENKKSGWQSFLSGIGDLKIPLVSSVANMAVGLLGSKLQKTLVNNHMSGAEREAAEFNAQEAQKARDWNLQMDNTKYQRQVADMQSAGINPALAMNGGVSTQATSNVTANASTQQAPMMSVVDLATTAANLKNMQAQKDLIDAQARLANANAFSVETENKYKDRLELAIAIGQEESNNLTKAEIDEINQKINESKERIKLIIAQAKTEGERQNALKAQALVDEANAEQIKALTPVLVELKKAETNEAKARAAQAFAQAAYQQGLIDEGYVKALAEKEGFNAKQAEQIALDLSGDNVRRGYSDTLANGEEFFPNKGTKIVANVLWQIADIVSEVLNINIGFSSSSSKSKSKVESHSTSESTSTNTNWTYHRPN